jgi:hypothetical protein
MLAGRIALSLLLAWGTVAPRSVHAHCDTLDGPVVTNARAALEKGDVTPILKWITQEDEAGIRERFAGAAEAKKHASENVDTGREFVRVYVEYVRDVERLRRDVTGPDAPHAHNATSEHDH